jgi:hypothetical protein
VLREIADEIRLCCGHAALKAHRLAWGWTVEAAIEAFQQMCREQDLGVRGLCQRSWLGWEAGGRPNDDYRDLLCRLFSTSVVRLGFGSDYTPAACVSITAGRSVSTPAAASPAVDRLRGDPSRWQVVEARVDANQRAPSGALDDLFDQSAAAAMEFTRRAEASDLGPQTLEHLQRVISAVAATFAYTAPAVLFPKVWHYRREVARLLDGRHTLRQTRQLYRCAGWLSVILGWLAHDLGDAIAADAHCIDAWEHGWQAEDGEICAWSMDTAATVAMYNNQPERALDAAVRGISHAPTGSPAAVRLSCQLSRAYGRLRRPDEYDRALAETRQSFDELQDAGSGLFAADAGRILSYAATSSVWLGRPKQAAKYAIDALDFYTNVDPADRSPTRKAITRLDLAMALLATDVLDGAAEQALQALECERLTGTLLARAGELDAAIRRVRPALPVMREVHDRYLAVASRPRALTAA